ncbi:MAG: hypothetical protein MJE77_02155 [Proteobacteria bacterium]|nr:hypothetical protein [Pseudomonadota bacterium]
MVDMIRACYRFDGDDDEWLSSVTEAMGRGVDQRIGALSFFFRRRDGGFFPWGFVLQGCTVGHLNAFLTISAHASDILKQRLRQASCPFGSLVASDLLTLPEVQRSVHSEIADCFGLWVTARDAGGCAFLFPSDRELGSSARSLARWSSVVEHISAGLRLRRLRASSRPDSEHLVRSENAADTVEVSGNLPRWAIETDRARAAIQDRGESHDITRKVSAGLMTGRWLLLSHTCHRGRRYLLARRVEARDSTSLRLTPSEIRAVRLALNPIYPDQRSLAQAMGTTQSTLASHLARAMKKLGVRSRAELLTVLCFEPTE